MRKLFQQKELLLVPCFTVKVVGAPTKNTMPNKTQRIINTIYDIFTAVVSVLDVITDIMVLVEFYILGRMEFFYASLTILIVAQIAYWYENNKNTHYQ